MSSHHFVREGQEPALLIVDALPFSQIGSVLEWVPLVLVMYPALEDVMSWGIKIDVVFAPEQEMMRLQKILLDQSPLQIISLGPEDEPLTCAFRYLVDNQQTSVNVVCQHAEPILSTNLKVLNMSISILTPMTKWSAVPSGIFKKWMPAGASLLIHSGESKMPGELKATRDGIITLDENFPFWVGEPVFQ